MSRPILNKDISPDDFLAFYWLKSELIGLCRVLGLSTVGGKQDITQRIHTFLLTGKKENIERKKIVSRFDWDNSPLNRNTIITDNFRNTYHVRDFMTREIGVQYRVNVAFLKWTKENIGKTLGDAIDAWKNILKEKKQRKGEKEIGAQFEYNTYIRDFLKDNPTLSKDDAIKYWKIKRNQRGNRKYCPSDIR